MYRIVPLEQILAGVINQPASNSRCFTAKFPEEKRVSSKIAVKANLVSSPPFEIVAQETHQFAADNFIFYACPELFWTFKDKFGIIFSLYG